MKETLRKQAFEQGSPLIVELVGLAGAGKTTLARALSQRDEKIQIAPDLKLRETEHLFLFTSHVPSMLPLFLRRFQRSRRFTWEEIKAVAYLEIWPRVLTQIKPNNGKAILLDQGPIFKLATLNAFGPEILKSQGLEEWWGYVLTQWANILDVVIWLNAPNEILGKRINVRNKRHVIKGKIEQDVNHFLRKYQESYQQIFEKVATYNQPVKLQYDTSQESIEQIVEDVLVHCNLN